LKAARNRCVLAHPAPRCRLSRARLIGILLLGVSIAALPGVALASGDWPQFQRDAAHTGFVTAGAQAPLVEAWHVDVPTGGPNGRYGLSSPVLSGGTVIAVGPTQVLGMDLATGQRRWSVSRDFGPSVPAATTEIAGKPIVVYTEGFGAHPPGSPAPASGATGVRSTSGASPTSSSSAAGSPAAGVPSAAFDSHLAAIDVDTREPLWDPIQLDRVSRTGVTIDGRVAFVGDNAGTVYAIDLATGRARWTAKTGGYVDTPLAAANGRLFVSVQGTSATSAAVVALSEADGSQIWRYEANREVLATAPAVSGDMVVLGLAGVASTVVRAIDATAGTERWSAPVNTALTPIGAPVVTPNAVIAQDVNTQIYRLDPVTGARTWDFAFNEPAIRTSPVVSAAQILVASNGGQLAVLDATTGELVWRSPPSDGLLRNPLVTSDVVVLVRGGTRPGLVAFVHDPKGALVRVASPTTIDPLRLLGGFAAAAAPLALILLLGGRWMAARAGPAFGEPDDEFGGDAWEEGDEP
jgi:outer membrane protein assembly factor BamB